MPDTHSPDLPKITHAVDPDGNITIRIPAAIVDEAVDDALDDMCYGLAIARRDTYAIIADELIAILNGDDVLRCAAANVVDDLGAEPDEE